jgi:hypothetical protein
MKSSKYILSSLVIVAVLVTALIPVRITSFTPFKLSTTAIAQEEQNPMQLMMLIMMLIMMMQQMNQNNELQGAQRERANDATENLLTQLNGLDSNQLNNQLPNPATP